jgi:uncharacterized Fe-S cluster-containing protein
VGKTLRFLTEHWMMQKVHSEVGSASRGGKHEDRGDQFEGVVEAKRDL